MVNKRITRNRMILCTEITNITISRISENDSSAEVFPFFTVIQNLIQPSRTTKSGMSDSAIKF